ncbi:hypothetical protein DN752_21100 [Echinicola strongylocentroti]|uniref:Uncharacterized protein n=1 Tax=Echinicola strongylocentroti TaxID=1795355 RepID=A0A2Z4IMV4_9BACT|nr:hypothetical protein [Echinicola strongylocentroti]AWW32441.1 hypothetical protein DN752_21100 [Echinicola strongylocentroti]
MKIIHLNEALEEMKKPEPFSITFITCDKSRKTGGDILTLDRVLLSRNEDAGHRHNFESPEPNVTQWTKRPSHYRNATRNVVLPNGHRRKFHIRLLLYFNGKKVFY